MRKRWYRRFLIMFMILVSVLGTGLSIEQLQDGYENQQVSTGKVSNKMVVPGGMPIGIYMKTDGILVLGTDSIHGMDGQEHKPAENLIKSGDYIRGINGEMIESKRELIAKIMNLDSEKVILQIRREAEYIDVKITAVMTKEKEYKLGIWVRDSVQGLGTITFLTADKKFGALGHGIHDSDTDELLEMKEGRVYKTNISNIAKGKKGTPGGMEGIIVYRSYNLLGTIEENTENGIYGTLESVDTLFQEQTPIPVCSKNEIKTGEAQIRSSVSGTVKQYNIEIMKIDRFTRDENKGMVIKVTDKELLEITGGIVQGMNGSPIIQDGKLIGAVTHVLVNDPTRGYGIFIENMLEATG